MRIHAGQHRDSDTPDEQPLAERPIIRPATIRRQSRPETRILCTPYGRVGCRHIRYARLSIQTVIRFRAEACCRASNRLPPPIRSDATEENGFKAQHGIQHPPILGVSAWATVIRSTRSGRSRGGTFPVQLSSTPWTWYPACVHRFPNDTPKGAYCRSRDQRMFGCEGCSCESVLERR